MSNIEYSVIRSDVIKSFDCIGPNFKHIFSSFLWHFVFSLTNNVYCTEISEDMKEIFRYVIHKWSFYRHVMHAWGKIKLNLHYFSNAPYEDNDKILKVVKV